MDEVDFSGIGHVLALTPNDEVNSLACLHFKDTFHSHHTFQLAHPDEKDNPNVVPSRLGGQTLFGRDITHEQLSLRFSTGASLRSVEVTNVDEFRIRMARMIPLFVITPDKRLLIWTANEPPVLQVGQTVIGLLDTADDDFFDRTETAFTPIPGILTSIANEVRDAIEPDEDFVDTPSTKKEA
jgi:hypothetical protein